MPDTTITIDEGKNTVTIVTPLNPNTPLSKSQKTRMLASTNGFARTTAEYKGKPVSVNLNVTIPSN